MIVLVPMVLNAHAGTKYGIPFPVYCRASFGILGANVPALLRALVACGWFGIQTWIGGGAIYKILIEFVPVVGRTCADLPSLGINVAQLGCFLFFWAINMWVIYKGIESIRILLNIKSTSLPQLRLTAQMFGSFNKSRLMLKDELKSSSTSFPHEYNSASGATPWNVAPADELAIIMPATSVA